MSELRQGLATSNPTEDVSSLRRLPRAVHAEGDLRGIALSVVLAGTGIRVGELLDLQLGDVEINERSGTLSVCQGKRGGYRQMPLTRDVRHALSAYLEAHADKDRADAPPWRWQVKR